MIFILLILIVLLLSDKRGCCQNFQSINGSRRNSFSIILGIIIFFIVVHIIFLFFDFRYFSLGMPRVPLMRGFGTSFWGC